MTKLVTAAPIIVPPIPRPPTTPVAAAEAQAPAATSYGRGHR
ncbi:hypothetical protein HMPREF9622_01107 [Cutibacterium modestum HL037PA3]|nr:hypothetical protein HMPREF9621_00721 [Cutibacterium modestum HL037PA2]EFT15856.1 hypothetical protein HMPREF9622_01107 [Cutibacterium modestum HL037PA3]